MDGDGWLQERARADDVIRIVSFNVRNGRADHLRHCWLRRRRAVLETIRRLDADLIGLQEPYAFQARWLCRRLPHLGWFGVGRTDGRRRGEQGLVLYRRDRFTMRRGETRWYGSEPAVPGSKLPGARFPRTATIVELDDGTDGTTVCFITTHLDAHIAANRLSSASQLAGWIDEMSAPVVLTGDLNEDVDGPAVMLLVDETSLRHACPTGVGGSSHDFTGRADGPRLDHILVPASWTVVAGMVDRRRTGAQLASDHWPVVADVIPHRLG